MADSVSQQIRDLLSARGPMKSNEIRAQLGAVVMPSKRTSMLLSRLYFHGRVERSGVPGEYVYSVKVKK